MSEKEKKENHVHVRWVHPCVDCGCAEEEEVKGGCSDDDHYHVSFEIPGVKKEDIELKIAKDNYRLRAKRADGEWEYISEGVFRCEVNEKEIVTSYDNGLLKVTAPYECPDPLKETEPLEIT